MANQLTNVREQIYVTGNAKVPTILECSETITCLQFTELYDYVFAGCTDGAIRVVKDGKLAMTLKDDDISKASTFVTGMKHHPVSPNYPITNTLTCTYQCGLVKCWNYNFQSCTFTLDEKRQTTGIAFHPKLAKFVTLGDNKKIYLYDEDSKRQERVLATSDEKDSTNGHMGIVTCACFHPKNVNELISGSLDNTVQFWDTRQPNATRCIKGVVLTGEGIDFSPTATEFVTCGNPKDPLRIWDYGSGKLIKSIEVDKFAAAPLKAGKFCSKNLLACGGGSPNILRVVDVYNYTEEALINNIINPVTSITIAKMTAHAMPNFVFSAGKRIYYVSPK